MKYLLRVVLIILAGISLLYGLGIWRTAWTFKYEVEPVDLINIVVTISCAIGAAWFVGKVLSEERFKKELVISDLKKIEEQVSRLVEIVSRYSDQNEEQRHEILSIIGYLQILIERFENVNTQNSNTEMRSHFQELYRCSTDFGTGNCLDSTMVIYESNELIKAIRKTISCVNEN